MALKFLNDGYFAGKVGIGVTNPSTKLDVNGDVQILNNLYFVDSNNKVVVDQSAGTAFDFHLNTQNIASLERYSTDSGQFQRQRRDRDD
jgi:hypothetical protein